MQHTNNIMLHSYVSSFCWMVFFSCVCVCEKLCTVSSFSPKMGYSARAWLMIKDHANIPYTITNHRTVSLLISSILYHFLFYVCPLHSSYQTTCQPATITTAPLCAWARLVIWHFHSTKSYVTPYRFTLKSSWDHSIKTMHRDRELGGGERMRAKWIFTMRSPKLHPIHHSTTWSNELCWLFVFKGRHQIGN